ncbi:MAG: hypothetical protein R2762_05040 [Bryobacteraceae bacterium]
MRTLLNFIRSQFKRPLVFPVAIGALTLIAQIASIAGTLHNSSAAWERTAVSGLETLARWLDGEAVRGPGAEARPGDGIAWSDFDKKLSGIESGLPPSF